MAYEIISQNNNTTTLSDGTNTITVPARVTLATSTSYTISEVNNNTATLEGSDGSVIRDVPCVVVLAGEGGGGSDQHNLGYYADLTALQTAYPTGTDGDFAILGSTDTIWVWDSGTSAWKDTDTKGQVTSVNGQTGAVTVDTLPTQTGQSGKFLTTDGTDASWSDKPLVNTATGANSLTILGAPAIKSGCINIGPNSSVGSSTGVVAIGADTKGNTKNAIAIGNGAQVSSLVSGTGGYGIAIGSGAKTTGNVDVSIGMGAGRNSSTNHCKTCIGYEAAATAHGAYQFGRGTNSEAGTVCFSLNTTGGTSASDWHNYKLLDSDGTIPTDRYTTTPVADGTYVPTLTISSGVATRSWAAPGGGGSTALSLTLAAANWSNNSITVTATGVTASNNVIVSPAPASQSAYTTAGVMCTGQSTDSLTFSCTTTPSSDLTVTVLII